MSTRRLVHRVSNNRQRLAVALILILYGALAAAFGIMTPVFEGYDENWHYAFVRHVASGKGLPRQPAAEYPHLARQEASQPPLYYLLAAAATWWVPDDDFDAYQRENPQFAPIPWGYRDNQNIIVHTDAERFPYQGTNLAVHLSRAVSVLLGAGVVYCTYLLARLLFPEELDLALGATILAAFTPGFLFTAALVSNDILVAFLCSLALVVLARLWKRPSSLATGVVLGLLLGLAALAKLSGLLLWPFTGLVLAALAWQRRDASVLLRVGLPAFSIAATVSGWWYLRNLALYGDILGLDMMFDIVGRREPGFGLVDLVPEFEGIRRSYWALFGWFNVPVSEWLYRAYDVLCLVGMVGLVLYAVRAKGPRRRHSLGAIALLLGWLALNVLALTRWTLTTVGSQGRLLYPAISAIAILLVRGWLELVPRSTRMRRLAVAGCGLTFLLIALCVPFFVVAPTYAKPTLLSAEQVREHITRETGYEFEGQVTMLGYAVEQNLEAGHPLWVTVCWKGETKIDEDYLVFVQLLVENDIIAAQQDTYHGLGTFPTSLWPAGAVFCDRYPLRVADTVPWTSESVVSLGLYRSSGERLQAYDPQGQPVGDNVRFPGPWLPIPEQGRTLDYEWGHLVSLVDYDLDRTGVRPGEMVNITLFWSPLRELSTDYVATVQILDEHGTKIGQSDIQLPMSTWTPGTVTTDARTLQISPAAAVGVHDIKVGIYEPSTVSNLTLYRNRQVVPGSGLLTLWGLRVYPSAP